MHYLYLFIVFPTYQFTLYHFFNVIQVYTDMFLGRASGMGQTKEMVILIWCVLYTLSSGFTSTKDIYLIIRIMRDGGRMFLGRFDIEE